jgi:6-phospho-beta-glucosidase
MGPGGFANALRTVPALVDTWATALERAPDALHINLTNPSGIVVAAVERELGARLISVCDSPITFCDAIAERLGRPVEAVRARYQGTNHLGWWVPGSEAELEAAQDLAQGQEAGAVRAQGALGAPYVRYYVHPGRILAAQQAAAEARAQQLQRLEAELLSGYQRGDTDLPRRGAVWYGTAVLPLVDAWLHGSEEVLTLGLRNDGRLPGLPDAVVTEGPVRIPRPGRLEPLPVPDLPDLPAATLAAQAAYELLTVAAARPGATRDDRLRALMANPLVTSWDQADALLTAIEARSPR